jgi:hypothetical protein
MYKIYYNNGNTSIVTYSELERLNNAGHINKFNTYKVEKVNILEVE